MTTILKQKYDKQLLKNLDTEHFQGRIFVINNLVDTSKAVDFLMKHKVIGIDTETRPSFKKGVIHKVAILQLATEDTAFLFQLKFIDLPDSIVNLLENQDVCKVGLSLKDDIHMLTMRRNFIPGSFVDLQNLVKQIGIQDLSLQKIYANFFGKRISKRKQLSNWNNDTLDEAQKHYAALDAVACLRIYNKINELRKSQDFVLQTIDSSTETVEAN